MDVEADDLIGTWAHFSSENKQNVVILSSDKDLMQCVNPCVQQMIRTPDNWHLLNATGVFEKMQVMPEQIVDYLALVGDSIDHYEGLPGVGPKTAANWLKQYGSLEKILQQKDSIEPKRFRTLLQEFETRLLRNQALAKLEIDMQFIPDIQKQVQEASRDTNRLKSLLKELNLNNLLKKLNLVEKTATSQQAEFLF
jgi:DNA polymerase-1